MLSFRWQGFSFLQNDGNGRGFSIFRPKVSEVVVRDDRGFKGFAGAFAGARNIKSNPSPSRKACVKRRQTVAQAEGWLFAPAPLRVGVDQSAFNSHRLKKAAMSSKQNAKNEGRGRERFAQCGVCASLRPLCGRTQRTGAVATISMSRRTKIRLPRRGKGCGGFANGGKDSTAAFSPLFSAGGHHMCFCWCSCVITPA